MASDDNIRNMDRKLDRILENQKAIMEFLLVSSAGGQRLQAYNFCLSRPVEYDKAEKKLEGCLALYNKAG